MADLILVATMLAFTAMCLAYIAWCDRITGVAVFTDRVGTVDLDDRADRADPPDAVSVAPEEAVSA